MRCPWSPNRPRREPSVWRVVGALLVAVAWSGCQPAETAWTTDRLIESDPALLRPAELTTSAEVESWPIDAVDGWQVGDDFSLGTGHRGLIVRGSRGFTWLQRDVDFDAAEIDVLTVATLGGKRSSLTLEWAGPDQGFDTTRRIDAFRSHQGAGGESVYRFLLRGEATWRGPIARIRMGLRVVSGQVVLTQAAGSTEAIDPAALSSAMGQPWRATLDNETRTVLLSLPGLETTHEVEPVAGTSLRFGYGVDPRAREPITFTVTAERMDADAATAPAAIFEDTLGPGSEGWREASVDLSSFAGRSTRLRLATASPEAHDPLLGFAYWAHPEIVSPALEESATPLPNVVLISIDTLRADHLSLYGYHRPTSPRLDAWAAKRATVFESAVAASPWTLPSHISMLTGLDAVHHGVNHARPMPDRLRSLAEVLRDAGATTGAVTAGGYVHPLYGLAQGFDRFRFFAVNMGHQDELEQGLGQALSWLDANHERPFFFFFHTYEVHMPFVPRQPWFGQFSQHDPSLELAGREPKPRAEDGYLNHKEWYLKRGDEVIDPDGVPEAYASLPDDQYDAGIAYTDDHIGRLLAHLETLGIAERTIVVVTSDHGDMLGEHGAHNHLYVYDENLLIPLVIADPAGRGAGARVAQQVRTVDIVPTVLALAGVTPEPGMDGVSLVPLLEGRTLPPEPAWSYASASNWGLSLRLQNRFKYVFKNAVWASPTMERDALFDLRVGESEGIPADAERLSPMRAEADALFRDRMPGLRIRLVNSEEEPLRGRLSGPMIGTTRVKRATADACDCFTLRGGRRLAFDVPPGGDVTIALEDVPAAALRVQIEGGKRPTTFDIDVATVDDVGTSIRWSDAAWTREATMDGLARGIGIWWQGEASAATSAPEDENAELREQLEALGYLGGG